MNDYEVSLLNPGRRDLLSGGGRTLLKDGLSLKEASAYGSDYLVERPNIGCDVWITQSTPGYPTKWLKPIYLRG